MTVVTKRPLWQVHPSAFLLAAQLLLLLLYAAFDGLHSEGALISAFGVVVLVLRVWVIRRSPGLDWIAWSLAIPALVLAVLSALVIHPGLIITASFFEAALYFYTAISLIAYMMEDYQVTTEELFAAGATWTLLAWGFAHLYLVCQVIWPGSFVGIGERQSMTFVELLVVSFTNLSATGFSDIVPGNTTARVLIMLEQFVGIGYVAIVISRLVSLSIQKQSERK